MAAWPRRRRHSGKARAEEGTRGAEERMGRGMRLDWAGVGPAGWTKGLGRGGGARSDVAPSWTAALAFTGDKVVKL